MPSRRTAATTARLPLQIRLLGGLDVEWRGGAAVDLSAKKARALLAFLALKTGRPQTRDSLASLLWGDMADEQARANLRTALFAIRRALGDISERVMRVDDETIAVDVATLECDALIFERALAVSTVDGLREAAALYRGELLHGFVLREAAFQEWLTAQRERMHASALAALRRLLDSEQAAGESEAALQTAHRLLAVDPLHESAHRALMRIYARQGQRGAAMRQYALCAGTLRRELGVDPDPETRRVYAEVVGTAAPAQPAPPRVVRRRTAPARAPIAARTLPLVGREQELAALLQDLDEQWAGRGHRLVLVLGEAGVGKTRLVDELATVVCQRHGRVLVGQAHQTDQTLSFGVWSDLLRGCGADDVARAKLEPVALTALASLAPALCPDVVRSVEADALRLFEAVTQLLAGLARRQPLLIVFDDLHWADDMSLRLLAHAARRLDGAAVMLVGTAREEEWESVPVLRQVVEDLTRTGGLSSLTLGPLSRDAADAMLRLLQPRLPEPAAASSDSVWRVSEGNPLVIVEIVAALADGALAGTGTDTLLPRRVRELIGHRLARLPAPSCQLLALAAVIGRQFDVRILQHATGLDEATVAEHLEELTRRRVLRDTGDGLDFSHVRVQEVAYELTPPTRRRALHGVIARAIEAVDPTAVDEQAHVLARHWREAGELDRAAARLLVAGRRAIAQSAPRHAMEHYEEALSLLATLPENAERLALGLALRLHAASARIPLGHAQAVARYAVETEALATRLGDEARLGVAHALASRSALMSGDAGEMLLRAEAALAIGRRRGELELTGDASYCASFASFMLGNYRYTVELARETIARGLDASRPEAIFTAPRAPLFRAVLAQSLAELGEAAEAEAIAAEALAWATERQARYAIIVASYARGHVAWLGDDTPGAIAAFARGAEVACAAGYIQLLPLMTAGLGIAQAREGHAESAVDTIRAALAQSEQAGLTMLVTHQSLWLAEVYLLAGRTADAIAQAERTETMARGRREAGFEAWALWVRGAALAHAGDQAAAESYRRAEAIAERLGMRPLLARCRARLALPR